MTLSRDYNFKDVSWWYFLNWILEILYLFFDYLLSLFLV